MNARRRQRREKIETSDSSTERSDQGLVGVRRGEKEKDVQSPKGPAFFGRSRIDGLLGAGNRVEAANLMVEFATAVRYENGWLGCTIEK